MRACALNLQQRIMQKNVVQGYKSPQPTKTHTIPESPLIRTIIALISQTQSPRSRNDCPLGHAHETNHVIQTVSWNTSALPNCLPQQASGVVIEAWLVRAKNSFARGFGSGSHDMELSSLFAHDSYKSSRSLSGTEQKGSRTARKLQHAKESAAIFRDPKRSDLRK
jgi:hypothetical protein